MELSAKKSKMESIVESAEFNRFGINSAILIITGCLGGVAVGLGAIESTLALMLIVIPTMATLSLVLAVAPMKGLLWLAALSTVINSLLIIYYTIF